MLIHLLGDSHTNVFRPLAAPFKVHPNIAACAHNIVKKGNIVKDIPAEDKIIFSFGEIDCRLHIYYQFLKTRRPITKIIEETIDFYRIFLGSQELYQRDLAILNIVPAGAWKENNPKWRDIGTPFEVKNILHTEVHYLLNEMARQFNHKIIDIWDFVIDVSGGTKLEYRDDEVHLSKAALPILLLKTAEVFPELKEEIMKANDRTNN
jgi:hypothetical protein